ncbi:MAG: ribbon-helix-helix protein, CopG family [Chlamydiae bacterium]|nr:ribbon-helix-helix protein, CopG family [Chlamydiota bacterium]MBI3266433.1 ribbon-helix-helix protein, CopG family [Chlamydiota bacterium]
MKSITTSFSIPKILEQELKKEARKEHRTKSGLIQEAIRFYLENKRWKKLQQDIILRASRLGISSPDDVEDMVDEERK